MLLRERKTVTGTGFKRSLLGILTAAVLLCGCMAVESSRSGNENTTVTGERSSGYVSRTMPNREQNTAPTETFNIPKSAQLVTENMTDAQKRTLSDIYRRISDFEDDIALDGSVISREDISDFIGIILSQMPYIDYIGSEYSINVDKNGNVTNLRLNYSMTKDEAKIKKAMLDQKLDDIMSGVNEGWSDYKKVLYFHDTIIDSCQYSESGSAPHSAYGCLIEGMAVCEGYTKAMQLLCARADIDCVCVSGFASDEQGPQPHIWNKIMIEDEWTNIDVTWDDPMTASGSPYRRYDYFGLTDEEISITHEPDDNRYITYPAARSEALGYYIRMGYYYDGVTSAYDVMQYAAVSSMTDGDYAARIKCSDADHYNQAVSELFDDYTGYGAEIYNILYDAVSQTGAGWATNEFALVKNDGLYTITVFFR